MSEPFILCVDDEKIVTDSLVQQLSATFGEDFQYEAASGVEEAWEVLDDMTEDGYQLRLIISDWLMPKKKGDQLLREVAERLPKVEMIMLSGQADQSSIDQLREIVPHFSFVNKPWQKQELMDLITQKLGNHE